MNSLGDSKGSFSIVRDAFEEQSDLHYTTLALDATETIDNIDSSAIWTATHRHSDERKDFALWVLSILLAMTVGGGIWSAVRLRHCGQQLDEANKLISELSSRHKEEINVHIERIKDQETTVTTNALQLARVNETIELIRDLIKDKRVSDADKLKSISTSLATLAPQTELWEIFKINFEQVHSGFFSRLYGKHPDLTPIEARMCAYLAMNLSSKEIAALTNRSLRSVESIRYRLNKKIALPKDVTLATYLRYFTVSESQNSVSDNRNSPE